MTDKLEVSRDIAAAPSEVYAAISDVTRMGEWSEECYACNWHEGSDGAVRCHFRWTQPSRRARVDHAMQGH